MPTGRDDKAPSLSLLELFKTMAEGMRSTVLQALRPEVTEAYPAKQPRLPWGVRSQLYCDIHECIGCFKCAKACPVDCIRIDAVRVKPGALSDTADGHKRMFNVLRFDIDMGQCCYCGLCTGRSSYVPHGKSDEDEALAYAEKTAVCPSDCLNFYPRFENGTHDAGNLVYHFAHFNIEQANKLWDSADTKARRTTHADLAQLEYLPNEDENSEGSPRKGQPNA